MMKDFQFRLTRDDLARQLHLTLRELYPEKSINGNIIHKMLIESTPEKSGFAFPAADFAEINGINSQEFLEDLFRELSVESEKNLHDKFLFEISKDSHSIFFKMLKKD
ncbi:MAG: hypothetical protein NTV06_10030 [candidate division Zixibacteria bacterium]|nr:hypothetical protein [candidate division Zixibacteria bacterium]